MSVAFKSHLQNYYLRKLVMLITRKPFQIICDFNLQCYREPMAHNQLIN